MLRFLRAWAWVRWRVRVNAIERGDRADRIQRFTRATEVIGPIIVAAMMLPVALVALAVGAGAGYGLASGADWGVAAMHILRFALLAATALAVVGPVMLPSGRGIASLPRLLLLPISRAALFMSELVGGLAEPWVVAAGLAATALVIAAFAGGSLAAGAVGLVAAVLLLATLAGLGACFGALLHVLMGNRRRGEWLLVAALTLFSLAAMVPSLMMGSGTRDERRERDRDAEARIASALGVPAAGWLAVLPSELYVASVARAAGAMPGSPALPLGGLAAAAAGSLAAGWLVWRRAIERGGLSAGRTRAKDKAGRGPGWFGSASSGLAFTFVHHVMRTARGRALALPAIALSLVFAGLVAFRDGLNFGPFAISDGFSVAVFGVVMAFLTPVQLWMNQFAIDKAGLTMLSLQPLSTSRIIRGKTAGAAVLVGGIAALPIALGLVIGADLHPAYWGVLVISAVAAFLALAPIAALLSTYFPKSVDLASIGQRSNAHPLAGLIGGVLTFASAGPGVGAAVVGFKLMNSPAAAIGLAAAWLVVALALHWMLTKVAVRAFDHRREALVALAVGR